MIKYRQDIDGLRALAIISVIVFHMFPEILPGGFIGVDIFFIISGYLIGATVLNDYDNKKFSFLKFYQKRLIRIIPLLVVVLATISILGYFLLTPAEFKSLGRHLAAASVFGSNFQLLKEINYFAAAADTKPLLHLWSLGIEEQFYLALPFLLMFFGRKKERSFYLILATIIVSFLYCCYLLRINQGASFFRPESRFWELLIGVAYSRFEGIYSKKEIKIKKYFGIVGFLLCLVGIVFFKGNGLFPGVNALVPTIGALLIIISGNDGLVNKTLFSNAIIVFVGKISYSLYLWHWPFLSITHLFYPEKVPFKATLVAIFVAFLFSIFTYFFVEKPLKHLNDKKKKMVSIFSLFALVSLFVCGRMIYKEKIKQSFVEEEVSLLMEASMQWVDFSKIIKSGGAYFTENEYGKFITRGRGPVKIAFVGDSHSEQYFPLVERFVEIEDPRYTVYFLTRPGCSGLLDVKHKDTSKKDCYKFFEDGYKFLENEKISKVIFSSFWGAYFTNQIDAYIEKDGERFVLDKDSQGFELAMMSIQKNLKRFKSLGVDTYIIPSIPFGYRFQPTNMFERRLSYPSFKIKYTPFDLEKFYQTYGHIINRLKEVAHNSGATVIDPIPFLCREKECDVLDIDGRPMYVDANHFRIPFVREKMHFLDFIFN